MERSKVTTAASDSQEGPSATVKTQVLTLTAHNALESAEWNLLSSPRPRPTKSTHYENLKIAVDSDFSFRSYIARCKSPLTSNTSPRCHAQSNRDSQSTPSESKRTYKDGTDQNFTKKKTQHMKSYPLNTCNHTHVMQPHAIIDSCMYEKTKVLTRRALRQG